DTARLAVSPAELSKSYTDYLQDGGEGFAPAGGRCGPRPDAAVDPPGYRWTPPAGGPAGATSGMPPGHGGVAPPRLTR
ncbi:hypothetical protein AB0E75_19585, partial [Streptomyces griseoviridis]